MLKYSKIYLPLQTTQRMYFSIVDSHFRSVWGCTGDTILKKLPKLRNRAARVVTNSGPGQARDGPGLNCI